MKDEIKKTTQSSENEKTERLAYEKPILNSISTQLEVNGVVSNCSMGQNVSSCSSSEDN